MFQKTTR